MRIAYLDCACGISGDMTLAALLDAGVDEAALRAGIGSLNLPGVELQISEVRRCGFRARHIRVTHPEQHAHRHLHHIFQLIDAASDLSSSQRELAKRIFTAISEAEALVHQSTIEKIHFHEVGAVDSIVDIVGAAIGFDLLGADEVVCSPVPTGRGSVRIAHGVCPVPTPGTAELLKGVPLVDVPVDAELTTPTGAAIVKVVAQRFGALPAMTLEQVGYGAGTRDFADRANILRICVGTVAINPESDRVLVLETNLDDVTGEVLGYTQQRLLASGALEVFSSAVQMKKNRPGTRLTVLCRPEDHERLEAILFAETATFGIRRSVVERSIRRRTAHPVTTAWGPVAGKLGAYGEGETVFVPEFEDCARIAREQGIPLRDVYQAAERAYAQQPMSLAARLPQETPGSASAAVSNPAPAQDHSHDHDHDQS